MTYKNKDLLPLILLLWIPITISAILHLYFYLAWKFFGITMGITHYYTSNFKDSDQCVEYFINELGWFGCILFIIITIWYLKLTKYIFT